MADADQPALSELYGVGPNEYVEVVHHACRECTESGPWTITIRDKDGRATQYDMWDVDHSAATGHKKFYQHKISRSNAHIM